MLSPQSCYEHLFGLSQVIQINLEELAADEDVEPAVYYSLHGHAHALLAMLGVLAEKGCCVPLALLDDIFNVVTRFFTIAGSCFNAKNYAKISFSIQVYRAGSGFWQR